MTRFILDRDTNLVLGKGLSSRGYEVVSVHAVALERMSDEHLLAAALERDAVILSHNERRFLALPPASPSRHAGILLVPQSAEEDVPRVVEAVHRLVSKSPELAGRILRFGLRGGWRDASPESPG